MTHNHEYIVDTRPEWGGAICRICGFHVPKNMMHISAVQSRIVKSSLTELEQAAMRIVLETPRRSINRQNYVRRELITMLETVLRKCGHGKYLDEALQYMQDEKRSQS